MVIVQKRKKKKKRRNEEKGVTETVIHELMVEMIVDEMVYMIKKTHPISILTPSAPIAFPS